MNPATKKSKFVHLRVHSSYSLSEGAIKIEEMADLGKKHNMPAMALTDSGNLFGALEFAKSVSSKGIQPITGSIVNLAVTADHREITGKLLLLAKDKTGFGNLLKLVSKSFVEGADCHNPRVSFDDLQKYSAGIIALTGGSGGLVSKYLLANNNQEAEKTLLKLKEIFQDSLYMELQRHGLQEEKATEKPLIDFAYKYNLPLVATNECYFASRNMFEAHDILLCIADGTYISEEKRRKSLPEYYFKSAEEMTELFSDIPEAIENTLVIARRCAVMPEAHAPMLPDFPTEYGRSQEEELRDVAYKGLCKRLGLKPDSSADTASQQYKPYFERLEYELDVIIKMGFSGYFLIVSDFIRWSKNNGIPVGPGRGSGAGSLVAWAMQITDLDPLRFGLLFERFLNPERISMPDFDIDFCQERRDEVINYVRQKYGKERVAQIITFGKLQARAVLRDVGRVLQLPYSQVDKICKMVPFNPISPVTLAQAIEMDPQLKKEAKHDEQIARLLDIGLKLEGLHRHASTHAAGVVIAPKPLDEIIPVYSDNKSDIPITQYSMKYVEMAGLVKFDFLGLKTLTIIDQACQLIRNQGTNIDINDTAYNDLSSYKMMAQGNTTGVFQVESSGMRDTLRKMKPDSIEDITALISLYRPGPMENIPTYISRKHGREKPDYPHPILEKTLKETFGVIIYQEQVMEIAKILAGYTLGGADLLRRAMGKKVKAEMDAQRDIFVEGAIKNGVDKDKASEIFELVAKFAGYGFNKSHAAAYAVIGYQTAYLKANYPVEFITASMNIDIGDTDKLNIFREEAVRSGIKILPPDINRSGAYFVVEVHEGKKAIRYALGALKGVGLASMSEVETEKRQNGAFSNLFDFAARCGNKVVNKRQIESLAKSGAFDLLNNNRRQVFESATMLSRYSQSAAEEKASSQISLFGETAKVDIPPPSLPNVTDWPDEERMKNELEAIGFYLTSHPLDSYQEELAELGALSLSNLEDKISGSGAKIKIAGVPVRVTHRAASGRRFSYLYISDPSGTAEISVFNEELISEARELMDGNQPLLITIDARKDEGGVRLLADSIILLEKALEGRKYELNIEINNNNLFQPGNMKSILTDISSKPDKDGMRTIKIVFTLQIPGSKIQINVPSLFKVSKKTVKDMESLPGVAKIFAKQANFN